MGLSCISWMELTRGLKSRRGKEESREERRDVTTEENQSEVVKIRLTLNDWEAGKGKQAGYSDLQKKSSLLKP